MPGLLKFYETATRAGRPVLEAILRLRLRRGKEDAARLGERMGRPGRPRPNGKLVWIHAASVGEAQSALILIDALERRAPGINILVTTGTVTSAAQMERRLPAFAVHQYIPLDHPAWVENFLNHWRPDLVLWMESELWPNMLGGIKRRNIPASLVNARLSDRSHRNWRFAPDAAKEVLRTFSLILAQTEKDASHYRDLGADNVIVTDNIKYSAAPLPHDDLALAALKLAVEGRPVWVYASTHAGEESLACRVHKSLRETIPNLLTIVVPRHPQRREEIAGACFENGVKYTLRSQNAALPSPDDDMYIADTMGELGLFYTLCDIAMIGRSFSNDGGGGHNPVEAAQLGCAVLTGPNNQYQRQLYDDMRAGFAVIEAQDEDDLTTALRELFTDAQKLKTLQERCTEFANAKTHVIDGVFDKLAALLGRMETRNAA